MSKQVVMDEDEFIAKVSKFPPAQTTNPSPGLGSRVSNILVSRLNIIVLLMSEHTKNYIISIQTSTRLVSGVIAPIISDAQVMSTIFIH